MSSNDEVNLSDLPFSSPRPIIYLTGDSLTQWGSDPDTSGWVAMMQHHYNRSADLILRGLSGYNTKWFVESVLPVMKCELDDTRLPPSLITLWLGANDAALSHGIAAHQHVPLTTYKENLAKIVDTFQTQAPDACILLITPPHVDDAVRASCSPNGSAERTNAATGAYARACVEVAHELKLNVLDLYSFFHTMPAKDRAACLCDGLHFTAMGNRLVYEQLQAKISEVFPELVKQLESWQFPNYTKFG